MVDIVPLWLIDAGARDYSDISTGKNGLSNYLDYANLTVGTIQNTGEADIYTTNNTLSQQKSDMMDKKNTTLDLFMQ